MDNGKNWPKSFLTLAAFLSLLFAAACAEVPLNLNTIPAPQPTAKLRVFIQPVSGYNSHGWRTSHAEYARLNVQAIGKFWQETGIYEMVEEKEVNMVLGKQSGSLDWSRKDWTLARQVGRALHAEYAMIVERSEGLSNHFYWDAVLINMETGRKYKFSTEVPTGRREAFRPIVILSYQKIFSDAKNDLLATAIRKGRQAAPEIMVQQVPAPEDKPAPAPELPIEPVKPMPLPSSPQTAKLTPLEKSALVAKPKPGKIPPTPVAKPESSQAPVEKVPTPAVSGAPKSAEVPSPRPVTPPDPRPLKEPIPSTTIAREAGLEEAPRAELQMEGGKRLAVYDLEAIEAYKVVALILSEALRQELFKLKLFHLVNRENVVGLLKEITFQQSGLVDEKEAVKIGKGLGVQQIVLGRYGTLGKTSIIQAKRLDVETQGALGLGFLKCDVGQEDELLQHMGELAKEIAKE